MMNLLCGTFVLVVVNLGASMQVHCTYFIDVHRTDMLTPATLGPLYTHTVVEVADDTSFGHIEQDESTLRNMINTNLN